MKETTATKTMKVANQMTFLQKATIALNVLVLFVLPYETIWTWIVSYILYKVQNKKKEKACKIVSLAFIFIISGPVNVLLAIGNVKLLNTFSAYLPKKASSKEEETTTEAATCSSSTAKNNAKNDDAISKASKEVDPQKDVDLWLNHFGYAAVNRFIMEADSCGCDFLEVEASGKVVGYGEKDDDIEKLYEDTIDRLPDSKFFPYICSEFERIWREISTDYSNDKFIVQWK